MKTRKVFDMKIERALRDIRKLKRRIVLANKFIRKNVKSESKRALVSNDVTRQIDNLNDLEQYVKLMKSAVVGEQDA